MTPIEAAADQIAQIFSSRWRFDRDKECIAKIITRHLFPVVRPEDCDRMRLYYYKSSDETWTIDDGAWATMLDDIVEIRGPIPEQPEVTKVTTA